MIVGSVAEVAAGNQGCLGKDFAPVVTPLVVERSLPDIHHRKVKQLVEGWQSADC